MFYKLILPFLFFLFATVFYLNGQESYYTQSGYASLTVRLSGECPDSIDISIPHITNPLSHDKPVRFQTVDDSTLMLSFFTFGPTQLYFNFNKQYLSSVLLPNRSDILQIYYSDSVNYTMNYIGYFKDVFDNSHLLQELIKNSFEYRTKAMPGSGIEATFKSANVFRDSSLKHIEEMTKIIGNQVRPAIVKQLYVTGIKDYFKTLFLVDYKNSVMLHNRNAGLDSSDAVKFIPTRNLSYYDGVISRQYADTSSLISGSYYDFLKSVRNDSLLNLPSYSAIDPNIYYGKLKKTFGHIFLEEDDLFFDMMIANVYIEKIDNGELLSNGEKEDIMLYFKNKHISNYILYRNDMSAPTYVNSVSGKYYLPFEKKRDSVMTNILSRYEGKVIVMDFWATWCGPCIEAFDQMEEVKIRYANTEDVVFIYMADESSDYGKWNDYVNVLGDEHYYLHNNQSSVIAEQYRIKYLPAYLVFNKNGALSNISVGDKIENQEITAWIEKALNE